MINIGMKSWIDFVVSSITTVNEYVSLQYPDNMADAPSNAFY